MTQKTLFSYNLTLEEAKELIKNGADVNKADIYGATPLFYVSNIDIANLLIVHGADVNHFTSRGETPLFNANNIDIIDLFVKHGAYVNKCDIHGNSVLDSLYRLSTPRKDMKHLIEHGSIAGKIVTYQKFRNYFNPEQQKAFDSFLLLTNDDNQFFQMCLAYQENIKNNCKINIKEMNII